MFFDTRAKYRPQRQGSYLPRRERAAQFRCMYPETKTNFTWTSGIYPSTENSSPTCLIAIEGLMFYLVSSLPNKNRLLSQFWYEHFLNNNNKDFYFKMKNKAQDTPVPIPNDEKKPLIDHKCFFRNSILKPGSYRESTEEKRWDLPFTTTFFFYCRCTLVSIIRIHFDDKD